MTAFMPGPYSYEVRRGHAAGPRYVITAPNCDRLAIISERGGCKDPLAQAQLFAAAPDQNAALLRALELCEKALPQFNWGASALSAEAIALLNEVPSEIRSALAKADKGD